MTCMYDSGAPVAPGDPLCMCDRCLDEMDADRRLYADMQAAGLL